MKKALVKKKVPINYFDKQEKPWIFLKIFQAKTKNFKGICAVLDYSKLKTFCQPTMVANIFSNLGSPNYVSASTVLICYWNGE